MKNGEKCLEAAIRSLSEFAADRTARQTCRKSVASAVGANSKRNWQLSLVVIYRTSLLGVENENC